MKKSSLLASTFSRTNLMLMVALVLIVAAVASVITKSALREATKRAARAEIMSAIERMQDVADKSDTAAIIEACNSLPDTTCRFTDYMIIYRGHRVPPSSVEITHLSGGHNVQGQTVALARIDRQPRVLLERFQ